jgi:hypothetical protein
MVVMPAAVSAKGVEQRARWPTLGFEFIKGMTDDPPPPPPRVLPLLNALGDPSPRDGVNTRPGVRSCAPAA